MSLTNNYKSNNEGYNLNEKNINNYNDISKSEQISENTKKAKLEEENKAYLKRVEKIKTKIQLGEYKISSKKIVDGMEEAIFKQKVVVDDEEDRKRA